MEGNIGADQRIFVPSDAWCIDQHFFAYHEINIGVTNRRSDYICIGRRAEGAVGAVEFEASSTVADQTKIADFLVLADAIKDKFDLVL